jgi:hypothetical protein
MCPPSMLGPWLKLWLPLQLFCLVPCFPFYCPPCIAISQIWKIEYTVLLL